MSLNDFIAGTYCTYNQNVSYTNMENKSGEGYFLYPINSQSNVSLKSVKDFMLGLIRISCGHLVLNIGPMPTQMYFLYSYDYSSHFFITGNMRHKTLVYKTDFVIAVMETIRDF